MSPASTGSTKVPLFFILLKYRHSDTNDVQTGFEWRLMIIVLVCNASKLVCFVSILKMRHLPLITIGDAIGSFLSSSDMSFRAHAPLTILDTRKTNWKANALKTATAGPLKQPSTKAGIRRWGKSAIERRFFFRSASISRWLITVTCCMTLLGVSIYLLLSGVRGSNNSFQWVLGQSALTTSGYLSYFEGGRLLGSLLTNLPQLLISSVYVSSSLVNLASYFPNNRWRSCIMVFSPA